MSSSWTYLGILPVEYLLYRVQGNASDYKLTNAMEPILNLYLL